MHKTSTCTCFTCNNKCISMCTYMLYMQKSHAKVTCKSICAIVWLLAAHMHCPCKLYVELCFVEVHTTTALLFPLLSCRCSFTLSKKHGTQNKSSELLPEVCKLQGFCRFVSGSEQSSTWHFCNVYECSRAQCGCDVGLRWAEKAH